MKNISKRNIMLIALMFTAAHIAIVAASIYWILGGDVLSHHEPRTGITVIFLSLCVSTMLWIHSMVITNHLCKAGVDAKTLDRCLHAHWDVWFCVALVFGALHYFILHGTGVNMRIHQFDYFMLFMLDYSVCRSANKLFRSGYCPDESKTI